MSKILVKQQSNIMYTRDIGGPNQRGGFFQDLAALRGGATGLNAQGGQSFIPGSQLGAAKPTAMQRLGAAGNIAGRGLAAALTGLQTAHSLQGGNVGAIGNIRDTYAQNVQGLTGSGTTEAQQAQNIATDHYNKVKEATQHQDITGMPSKFLQEVQNAQQGQQQQGQQQQGQQQQLSRRQLKQLRIQQRQDQMQQQYQQQQQHLQQHRHQHQQHRHQHQQHRHQHRQQLVQV